MNPASVENVNSYVLLGAHGGVDPIALATYDPTAHSVTLRPKIRVNFHRYYTLAIHAQGAAAVTSAADVALDGMKTGQPGNDYVATVHHFSLTPRLSQPTVKEHMRHGELMGLDCDQPCAR